MIKVAIIGSDAVEDFHESKKDLIEYFRNVMNVKVLAPIQHDYSYSGNIVLGNTFDYLQEESTRRAEEFGIWFVQHSIFDAHLKSIGWVALFERTEEAHALIVLESLVANHKDDYDLIFSFDDNYTSLLREMHVDNVFPVSYSDRDLAAEKIRAVIEAKLEESEKWQE